VGAEKAKVRYSFVNVTAAGWSDQPAPRNALRLSSPLFEHVRRPSRQTTNRVPACVPIRTLAMLTNVSLKDALPLERWHKANFVTGFLLLVVSLILTSPWLPRKLIGALGLGLMFMGLGNWKTIREQENRHSFHYALGCAFWLFGLAMLGWFVWNLGLLLYRG
jgi:hypothetical protein